MSLRVSAAGSRARRIISVSRNRALARKVSDEFAVPLCSFHHDEVHRTGNEFQ